MNIAFKNFLKSNIFVIFVIMEIKFRVWHEKENRMIHPERSDCAVWVDENGWALLSHFSGKIEEIIPINKKWENLMLFTGRVDKNIKPIYRGDVVKNIEEVFDFDKEDDDEISYEEKISFIEYRGNGFWVANETFGWSGESLWDWEDMEVIGNIFENSELLK